MIAVFQESTSLENMYDIVMPGPVPWWPPATGWYVLGAVVLMASGWWIAKATIHWWQNRYRMAALEELGVLRERSRDSRQKHEAISGLDRLLKRVALVGWPRQNVARLSGDNWIEFLTQSAPGTFTHAEQAHVFRDIAYSKKICEHLTDAQIHELFDSADRWIRLHESNQVEVETPSKEVQL